MLALNGACGRVFDSVRFLGPSGNECNRGRALGGFHNKCEMCGAQIRILEYSERREINAKTFASH